MTPQEIVKLTAPIYENPLVRDFMDFYGETLNAEYAQGWLSDIQDQDGYGWDHFHPLTNTHKLIALAFLSGMA